MNNIPIFISILPFLVFLFLLFSKKTSLLVASIITLLFYTVLAVVYWKIMPSFLYTSYGKGFFIAIDIFFIIFGAIFFLEILKDLKIIKNISYYLESFSKDYRIQIIVIAWLFEALLEGTAGFGVPAAVAVPLLMGLGLTPLRALIIGLLGNSAPGVFGAAGTPIRVGLAGLPTSSVPFISSMLNLVGIIVPVFMLWIITKGRPNRKKEFFEGLPFAIWSGIVFSLPSILFVSLGQEFPTILGSVAGLALVIITTKLGIFVPKNTITVKKEEHLAHTMSPLKAFLPYGLLVALLIFGKIILDRWGIMVNFGFIHTFNLFNPGFIFIVTGLIVILFWRSGLRFLRKASFISLKGTIGPFIVIVSMSAIVQIMILSGNNLSGLPPAITLISKAFETSLLPLFAPFIGAFGSFITGSVTISNIMFGNFFYVAATNLNFNPEVIMSLGVVGAATGNMLALSDILAAEAVAGVKNFETHIFKGVIIPCITCLLLIGILGIIIFK
ncbi:MAG TPA: L-lactate permease [Candidatus Paceibacterota bacterium]|nr:L-lactate permease [Candidatus Paceibacterota bacterium]